MNKLFLSKEEVRGELVILGNKYLNPEDTKKMLSIFDDNISGKHILYILSSRRKIVFSEEDQDKLKTIAYNLGV